MPGKSRAVSYRDFIKNKDEDDEDTIVPQTSKTNSVIRPATSKVPASKPTIRPLTKDTSDMKDARKEALKRRLKGTSMKPSTAFKRRS